MYELFVLACLMHQPNHCVTLKDLHSPHSTHDKCLSRAYEIAQGMPIHMPMYYPMRRNQQEKEQQDVNLSVLGVQDR